VFLSQVRAPCACTLASHAEGIGKGISDIANGSFCTKSIRATNIYWQPTISNSYVTFRYRSALFVLPVTRY